MVGIMKEILQKFNIFRGQAAPLGEEFADRPHLDMLEVLEIKFD
jgi:hypothetical protein